MNGNTDRFHLRYLVEVSKMAEVSKIPPITYSTFKMAMSLLGIVTDKYLGALAPHRELMGL